MCISQRSGRKCVLPTVRNMNEALCKSGGVGPSFVGEVAYDTRLSVYANAYSTMRILSFMPDISY